MGWYLRSYRPSKVLDVLAVLLFPLYLSTPVCVLVNKAFLQKL